MGCNYVGWDMEVSVKSVLAWWVTGEECALSVLTFWRQTKKIIVRVVSLVHCAASFRGGDKLFHLPCMYNGVNGVC